MLPGQTVRARLVFCGIIERGERTPGIRTFFALFRALDLKLSAEPLPSDEQDQLSRLRMELHRLAETSSDPAFLAALLKRRRCGDSLRSRLPLING